MTSLSTPLSNIVSIDVEDWFQVENFAPAIPAATWDGFPLRVERNVETILELFRQSRTRGTFFILGWVAERLPHVIRRIAEEGHEIASHGWSHAPVWRLSPDEFRSEVARSRALLEDLTGQRVIGYRAPTFSIVRSTLWALDILLEEGYVYDSSIFPVWHDRYGIPDAPLGIHQRSQGLWEIPLSVLPLGSARLPVAGGGYFRLYPLALTSMAIRQINGAGRPAVIYLHPWEFDPEHPKPQGISPLKVFRHRVGLASTAPRLASLLKQFSFIPARQVIDSQG